MALKRGIVELENYNSKWEEDYKEEEKLLKKVLKKYIIEIHHIGSTSIKELMAKPIIDILIVIRSFDDIGKIEEILKKYNYTNRGHQGVNDRYFFAKGTEDARTHYIHFVDKKGDTYYNQLYFKRYLLEYPEYIDKYCHLKQALALKYKNERTKYTQSKNDFIKDIIIKAKGKYDD